MKNLVAFIVGVIVGIIAIHFGQETANMYGYMAWGIGMGVFFTFVRWYIMKDIGVST